MNAVECPGMLGNQVFAPLGKETQHLRLSLGIDRCQPLVAPGGQRGGEGIQVVVLASVASEAESTRTRAESLGGTSTTDSPAAANLPARCLPRDLQRSPPPNDARGTILPSAQETSSLL